MEGFKQAQQSYESRMTDPFAFEDVDLEQLEYDWYHYQDILAEEMDDYLYH